jgi:hypothetical protein
MGSRKKLFLKILGLILVLAGAWAAYDLYGPRTAHLREFDPDEVARLETAMWRSYYASILEVPFRCSAFLTKLEHTARTIRLVAHAKPFKIRDTPENATPPPGPASENEDEKVACNVWSRRTGFAHIGCFRCG